MKVHLGQSLKNNSYILTTDDNKFYWTEDTSEIIGDKFETLEVYEYQKWIEKWIEKWVECGIQKLGYFDTDEYPSINAYKKDYPEFFI
jgi:hypothetical protein